MTPPIQLPPFRRTLRGRECAFVFENRRWKLRRHAEQIGQDSVARYVLTLEGRELDPFVVLDEHDWRVWQSLPYRVPHDRLCPGHVPAPLLCGYVQKMIEGFERRGGPTCFWPLAA